jgi:hypothetical protein
LATPIEHREIVNLIQDSILKVLANDYSISYTYKLLHENLVNLHRFVEQNISSFLNLVITLNNYSDEIHPVPQMMLFTYKAILAYSLQYN